MTEAELLAIELRMRHLQDQLSAADEEFHRETGLLVVAACLMIAGYAVWQASELAGQDIDDRLIYFVLMFEGTVMAYHAMRYSLVNKRIGKLTNSYMNTAERLKDYDAN